jgi:transcriptional regulator with XRE-family HTH domain
MEEQHRHEISQRMRQLRDDSSETNRSIADAVEVGERTVAGWLSPEKPTGISYKNAKKVADLFGVDIDWLWRGAERGPTPDPFAPSDLARVESKLDALIQKVASLDARLRAADTAQRSAESPPRSQSDQREDGDR